MNDSTSSVKRSGATRCTACPCPSKAARRLFGSVSWNSSALSLSHPLSLPTRSNAGVERSSNGVRSRLSAPACELPYPTLPYSLTADAVRSLRVGLPASKTCFADTGVSTGSAVSTGVDESEALVRTSESPCDSEDVDSECPTPTSSGPRKRMFHAAFASLSASNPQAGQECSRTHNGFSAETPQDAHSLVVPLGFTATKCVPYSLLRCFRHCLISCNDI